MDLPTPVPASTMRFSDAANAARTASAIMACSLRGSKSGYSLPTSPSASKA